jgi:hypothetical protein
MSSSRPGVSINGRIADATGRVPRALQLEYGTPGATHRGQLSSFRSDGTFEIADRGLEPAPVTLLARGDTDDGPVVGLLTVALAEGPNDVDVVVGTPGTISGRVVMEGGIAAGARLALVRTGFQPLGEPDRPIELAPNGSFEAAQLIGEYRVRVDEPRGWTVTSIRRRGIRRAQHSLTVGNGEEIDGVEILIGPR